MAKSSLVVSALHAVRRGRPVVWTDAGMNFGNYLYFWRYAYARREAGQAVSVLVHPSARPWIEQFPKLGALSITPAEVRFLDARVVGHNSSEFDVDFGAEDLRSFVSACLTSESWLTDARCTEDEDLLINVRRGDYYSVEKYWRLYGIDQESYIRRAVDQTCRERGSPRRIRVISDGLDWCTANLAWLRELAPVDFGPPKRSPFADFAAVANARRLVLSNSTFSYWGGYVSDVLHPDSEGMVLAPRFHRRDIRAGRAWQLNPSWTIVEEPEQGWGAGELDQH